MISEECFERLVRRVLPAAELPTELSTEGSTHLPIQSSTQWPTTKVAVAVSGGSDSLALAYLLNTFCKKYQIQLHAFIVNHQLRAEATQEAEITKRWLNDWGVDATILTWHHKPLTSGLMEKARRARYQLLALACHRLGIAHLFVGHHQDDLVETVLMRKQDHSHWRGLAGISACHHRYGLTILRPLLSLPKRAMEATLLHLNQPWITDPSNSHEGFLRTRIRQAVGNLSEQAIKAILLQTKDCGNQRQLEALLLAERYPVTGTTYLKISNPDFTLCSEDQGGVLLQSWVTFFVETLLRKASLRLFWQRLLACIQCKKECTVGTIGGCLLILRNHDLYIFREWGRLPTWTHLSEGGVWDHRFFCYGPCHGPMILKRNTYGSHDGSDPWLERHWKASFPLLAVQPLAALSLAVQPLAEKSLQDSPQLTILYRPHGLGYPHFVP